MNFDSIYGQSREELTVNIEAKLSEGWKIVSEISTVRPPNIDPSIPHYAYFVKVIKNVK